MGPGVPAPSLAPALQRSPQDALLAWLQRGCASYPAPTVPSGEDICSSLGATSIHDFADIGVTEAAAVWPALGTLDTGLLAYLLNLLP